MSPGSAKDVPSSSIRKLALYAAVLHAALVVAVAAATALLALTNTAQWQLTWTYLEALDWPVSLLLRAVPWPQSPLDSLPHPFRSPRAFLVPLFVFGVVGTAWYAVLGGLLGAASMRIKPAGSGGRNRPP